MKQFVKNFLDAFMVFFVLLIGLYVYDSLRVKPLYSDNTTVEVVYKEVEYIISTTPQDIDYTELQKEVWQVRSALYRFDSYITDMFDPIPTLFFE